jgi:hypothetical protein
MEFQPADIARMHYRISDLEKANRRLKRIGAAAFASIALFLVMAESPARKTIDANEFVVKDAAGNVRIRIGVDPKSDAAELWLQTPKGNDGAALSETGLVLKQNGVVRTILASSALTLSNSAGQPNVRLTAADDAERDLFIEGNSGDLSYLPGHALEISDSDGYTAAIGRAELRAPGAVQTNAAALTLFDPDKKVLWKAP